MVWVSFVGSLISFRVLMTTDCLGTGEAGDLPGRVIPLTRKIYSGAPA